jgi:DNA-binding phage protein
MMTKESGVLRKMSAAMTIDRGSLLRSLHDRTHSDWETIKSVMAHLGFELKFIRVVLAPRDTAEACDKVIPFPLAGNARAA